MFYFNFLISCSIVFLHLISDVVSLKSEKIFGGGEVFKKENENLFVIDLFYSMGGGKSKSICTGSLISNSFALTAAHCFVEDNIFDKRPYFVVVNTVNLTNYDDRNKIYVKKVYIPKVYTELKNGLPIHDIAVIELKTELNMVQNFPTVTLKLPEKNSNYENQYSVLFGYGNNKIVDTKNPKTGKNIKSEATDLILKYLRVKIEAVENCIQEQVYPDMFCGSALQLSTGENRAACGDSGGPLVIKDTIVGILSTLQCKSSVRTQLAYYTKVASFRDFIDDIINGNPASDTTDTYLIESAKDVYPKQRNSSKNKCGMTCCIIAKTSVH